MITKEHRQVLIKAKREKIDNRSFCKHGHAWTEENIRIKKDGRKACRICDNIDAKLRARSKSGTEEGKKAKKNNALRSSYGITLEDYNKLLEKQNYKCAICNRHQNEFTRKFAVDHCHITDKVRGLLCGNCNIGIGNLQDDINIIENALKYLRNANK